MEGIIGDYYPSPSRCLTHTEAILNAYLQSTLYNGVDLAATTGVFPTEGGSAAMVYIFEALECVSKMPEAHFRRLWLHFCVDFP